MKTIKELNEKAWYRFLKVIYLVLYLPFVVILLMGIEDYGHEYHPEELPSTIGEALADSSFRDLDEKEKERVLKTIDFNFSDLPVHEQRSLLVVSEFSQVDLELIEKIEGYEKKGYTSEEIIRGLLQGNNYKTLIPQIHLAQKKGFSADEIVQGIKWEPRYHFVPVDYDPFSRSSGPWEEYKKAGVSSPDTKKGETIVDPYDKSTWGASTGFVYSSYYTWKFKEAFYFVIVSSLAYFVVMEAIKRAFYYVVIGKVFPKE